jgi:hypothetical protein
MYFREEFMPKQQRLAIPAVIAMLVAANQAWAAEVPAGTHVLLRMMNSITTRTAQPGDYVYMRTATPVTGNGRIIVPPGSYVQGEVSYVKRSGRVHGRAQLGIRLETLTFPDGRSFHIAPRVDSVAAEGSEQKIERPENTIEQGSGVEHDAGQVAIFAGSGAALGALVERGWSGAGIGAGVGGAVGLATVLLSRGREVSLRQGATMDVVFDRAVTLQ